MEVYNVRDCRQYPSTNPLVFSGINIWQADGTWNTYHQVQQSWSTQVNVATNPSPSCNYGASATQSGWNGTATIMYSN